MNTGISFRWVNSLFLNRVLKEIGLKPTACADYIVSINRLSEEMEAVLRKQGIYAKSVKSIFKDEPIYMVIYKDEKHKVIYCLIDGAAIEFHSLMFESAFKGLKSKELRLSGLNTLGVDSFSKAFSDASCKLTGIESLSTINVLSFECTFMGFESSLLDLSHWNVSSGKSFRYCFGRCKIKNLIPPDFSSVRPNTSFVEMFQNARISNLVIRLPIENSLDMRYMFMEADIGVLRIIKTAGLASDGARVSVFEGMFSHVRVQLLDIETFSIKDVVNLCAAYVFDGDGGDIQKIRLGFNIEELRGLVSTSSYLKLKSHLAV